MVTTGETDTKSIGKLAVLSGVHQFPVRVKCAILPWHTMRNALDKSTQTITTE